MADPPPLTANPRSPPKRPRSQLWVMIGATLLGVLLIVASIMPLMFSAMIFDAGETPAAWTLFIALWSFPLAVLVGLAVGWLGFAVRLRGLAWAGLAIAALPILVIAGCFVAG